MIFRTHNEPNLSFYKNEQANHHFEFENEWAGEDISRIDEPSWQHRYDYESSILLDIIKENNYKNIIELGSGPGELGQKIIQKHDDELDYTFIDRIGAKDAFNQRKYKGTFLVKDLMNDFDISDLNNEYDFLITNDFLEHIYNPSLVLQKCYKIIKNEGKIFVSVPNWRMGHTFVYRGLFDYDNFVYFMYTHGFKISGVWESPLKCSFSPKETSESEMDDRLITSWNWYMLFDKI
jgi:2-polyprenyl-3-methyl-5-hydroxy-6-metoxy-1,4-benzoquinol methylase